MSDADIVRVATEAGLEATAAWQAIRVFGPSLKALGGNMGKWTDKWSANFFRISERAAEKLGDAADQPGEVSPRILQRVITDGAWCDDPVAHDYFAGLVAASRNPDGSDDSNLSTMTLLAGLGTREIRAHYLLYLSIRHGLHGGWRVGTTSGRNPCKVYLPLDEFVRGMALHDWKELPRVIASLARQGLIDDEWAFGDSEGLKPLTDKWQPPAPGLVVLPSYLGIDLALKADGPGPVGTADFLYGVGWTEVSGVEFDSSRAAFPAAPKTWAELQSLREKCGFVVDLPDPGWAVPVRQTVDDSVDEMPLPE